MVRENERGALNAWLDAEGFQPLKDAEDVIRELDATLSDYDTRSELRRLCRTAVGGDAIRVGDDLWTVLCRADEISRADASRSAPT